LTFTDVEAAVAIVTAIVLPPPPPPLPPFPLLQAEQVIAPMSANNKSAGETLRRMEDSPEMVLEDQPAGPADRADIAISSWALSNAVTVHQPLLCLRGRNEFPEISLARRPSPR